MNYNYDDLVQGIYNVKLSDITFNTPLKTICGLCGQVYDVMFTVNIAVGLWKSKRDFDHTLVFYIAGWVKDYINNTYTNQMTQKELADKIGTSIINYIDCKG